jgi:hypothetical protein
MSSMNEALVLTLPNEQRFLPLARLVLGGLASQFDLPYEQLDDLQLAVETVLADESTVDGHVTLRIEALGGTVAVSIHPASSGQGEGLALERVLSTLVDTVRTVTLEDGEQWLRLEQHLMPSGADTR